MNIASSCATVEAFAEFQVEISGIRDLGERLVTIGHLHGRGKESGADVESPIGYVVDFKNGKAVRYRDYFDPTRPSKPPGYRSRSATDALETASTNAFGGRRARSRALPRLGPKGARLALRDELDPRPRIDEVVVDQRGAGSRLSGFLNSRANASAPSKVRCRPSG